VEGTGLEFGFEEEDVSGGFGEEFGGREVTFVGVREKAGGEVGRVRSHHQMGGGPGVWGV
jgi:hypothetical protein